MPSRAIIPGQVWTTPRTTRLTINDSSIIQSISIFIIRPGGAHDNFFLPPAAHPLLHLRSSGYLQQAMPAAAASATPSSVRPSTIHLGLTRDLQVIDFQMRQPPPAHQPIIITT